MSNVFSRTWNRLFDALYRASPTLSNNEGVSVGKPDLHSKEVRAPDRPLTDISQFEVAAINASPAREVIRYVQLFIKPHPLLVELQKVINDARAWAGQAEFPTSPDIENQSIRLVSNYCWVNTPCQTTLKEALRQCAEDKDVAAQLQVDTFVWKTLIGLSRKMELYSVVTEHRGSLTKWLSIHADIDGGRFQVYEKENDCTREIGGERLVAKHDSFELAVRDISDRALLASLLDEQSSFAR